MADDTSSAIRLPIDEVKLVLDESRFGFASTEELDPLEEIVGQPRALRALELGLGVPHASYNVFVAGMSGMGKKRMIRQALSRRIAREPTPSDWIYVNNFQRSDRPLAIALPAGRAAELKRDVDETIEGLADELPRALQQEDLSLEKQRLSNEFEERARQNMQELKKKAEEKHLALQALPDGNFVVTPLKEGKPMQQDEHEQLSEEERAQLRQRQKELSEEATSILSQQRQIQRELKARVEEVERSFAEKQIRPALDEIRNNFESQRLGEWLDQMAEHMLDHLDRFQPAEEDQQKQKIEALLGGGRKSHEERFREYGVNVLVDNSNVEGAPVVIEDTPNYKNLFGIIDHQVDALGRASTDFSRIKAGSLLRAAGGYLVFDLLDAIREPFVWKELKRTIRSGRLQIQDYEPLGIISRSSLKPEPIELHVKLVVVGTPLIYHLLHRFDEDFKDMFKVKSEFSPEMDRTNETAATIGRFARRLQREEPELLPLSADGVAELMIAAARLAGDRNKLTGELSRVADIVREAGYWAKGDDGASRVGRAHVRRALDERVYRSELIAEKIRELIADGRLRVRLDGTAAGQVNGIAVSDLGDYQFGRPMRVTASVGVGAEGIINIERESKLSGRTYDKSMLILEGYLRNAHAGQTPLALSASLAMEQSYGGIDGDSASAAELLCLLSALAGLPLRQDIAVIGSVNQYGDIQAVGSVSEKIEGFFDVCHRLGLSGKQGVLLPASNVKNVVLRPDVLDAVEEGKLTLWTFDHIDQGLELMTGVQAGKVEQEESVHGRVHRRLKELARALEEQRGAVVQRAGSTGGNGASRRDPRPPLPGSGVT